MSGTPSFGFSFGQPAQTPAANPFGQPAQTPAANPFGQPAQTPAATPALFGQPAQTPAANPFGQPAQTPAANLFGQPAQTPAANLFGQPAQTPAANLFGQPAQAPAANLVGQPAQAPAANLFGQPAQTPAANLFGQPAATGTTATPNLFGQPAQAPAANLFGQPAQAPAANLFGQPAATGTTAATPAPAATAGVLGTTMATTNPLTATTQAAAKPTGTLSLGGGFGQPGGSNPGGGQFNTPFSALTSTMENCKEKQKENEAEKKKLDAAIGQVETKLSKATQEVTKRVQVLNVIHEHQGKLINDLNFMLQNLESVNTQINDLAKSRKTGDTMEEKTTHRDRYYEKVSAITSTLQKREADLSELQEKLNQKICPSNKRGPSDQPTPADKYDIIVQRMNRIYTRLEVISKQNAEIEAVLSREPKPSGQPTGK